MTSSLIKSIVFKTNGGYDVILKVDDLGAVSIYERNNRGNLKLMFEYPSFDKAIKSLKEVYENDLNVIAGHVDCKINLFGE